MDMSDDLKKALGWIRRKRAESPAIGPYKVIPSENARGYVNTDMPFTVIRNDGNMIARFHSKFYAEQFAALNNADTKA